MAKMEWDDALSVGVELIDEQHKMLIQRLSELVVAVEKKQGETEIMKTLQFMDDYTDFHFTSEEEQMAAKDYPGLGYQQAQHAEFKNTLKRIIEDFEDEGPTRALVTSINTFLYNWLVNHIKVVDQKFGEFLNNK